MVIVPPYVPRMEEERYLFYQLRALTGQYKCGRAIYQDFNQQLLFHIRKLRYHKNRRDSEANGVGESAQVKRLFSQEFKARIVLTRER